jgi:hypothetical protein
MKKRNKKRAASSASKSRETHARAAQGGESRAAEVVTVAWMVAATTVLMCDAAVAIASVYVHWRPAGKGMLVMAELLLLAGAVIGVAALALAAPVYRLRRTAPPTGLTVFVVCAAAAPILALALRAFR